MRPDPLARPMAATNPASPRSARDCCAAGGNAPIVGRRERSHPQTSPAISAPPPPPSVSGIEPIVTLSNPTSRPIARPPVRKAMSVRSLDRNGCPTRGTTRFRSCVEADEGHDVADVDLRAWRDRHFLTPAQSMSAGTRHAPCRPNRSTISANVRPCRCARGHIDLDHVTRDRAHHVLAFDLRADHAALPQRSPPTVPRAGSRHLPAVSYRHAGQHPRRRAGCARPPRAGRFVPRARSPCVRRLSKPDTREPGISDRGDCPTWPERRRTTQPRVFAASSLRLTPISRGATSGTKSNTRM